MSRSEAERIVAVDFSSATIAQGKRLPGGDAPNLRWIEGAVEEVALQPPYALVAAGSSLHWMEWDVVLPRFAQVLTPHGCLAIASEGTLAPSWHAALLPIIQRFSTNQEYQPYNLVEELERRRLFQKQGEPKMTPVPFQQSVNSYIESFHARNGFSRHRMTKEAPSVSDEEVRKLMSPFIMCEQLAVNPQACLYVGDGSSRELTGASRVGMHAVLIRVPYEDSDDAHRLDAEEWQGSTVSALEDLLALVV